jgi:hypothetical protein
MHNINRSWPQVCSGGHRWQVAVIGGLAAHCLRIDQMGLCY